MEAVVYSVVDAVVSSVGLQMDEPAARAIEPATQATLAGLADVASDDVLITGYSAQTRRLAADAPGSQSTMVEFAIVAPAEKLEGCSRTLAAADRAAFGAALLREVSMTAPTSSKNAVLYFFKCIFRAMRFSADKSVSLSE